MIISPRPSRHGLLREQLDSIRASWSPAERRLRARLGARRRNRLLLLLSGGAPIPEVWASGAPSLDDVKRIAG